MEMSGERRIHARRDRVWQALNDPLVLKVAIPGCESLEKLSDTELKAVVAIRMGPISTRFSGKVNFTDVDPPNGYRIAGEGQGGVAGFAKGGADVRLAEDGDATVLTYDVKAQVGGKMAQLGARLIDATVRQTADVFFTRFAELVAPPVAEEAAAAPEAAIAPVQITPVRQVFGFPKAARAPLGYRLVGWVAILLALAIVVLVVVFGGHH